MPFIEAFFTHEVKLKPFVRMGGGMPVYGKTKTMKCRLQRGKLLKTPKSTADGVIDEAPHGMKMFCVGKPIPLRSVVEYHGREFIVVDCRIAAGFKDDHLEVMLE